MLASYFYFDAERENHIVFICYNKILLHNSESFVMSARYALDIPRFGHMERSLEHDKCTSLRRGILKKPTEVFLFFIKNASPDKRDRGIRSRKPRSLDYCSGVIQGRPSGDTWNSGTDAGINKPFIGALIYGSNL